MVNNDAIYFERRAAEELLAAECAASPEAERAHRELYRRFSSLIADLMQLAPPETSRGASAR